MYKYGGYAGKILRVNLSRENLVEEPLELGYAEKFIGGRGLAARVLFEEVKAKVEPLSPDNRLILMTGPLAGTPVPGTSRFVVATKSPLTNIYAYAIAGGDFGSALKSSGYDGVIIEGESTDPTYLLIDNGEASLKDAKWLWGTPVFETERLIKETVGNSARMALIGPAGEKMVKYAGVITGDRRAAGRAGTGAVLGAKKIKGIVVKGQKRFPIIDRTAFFKALKKYQQYVLSLLTFKKTGTQAGPIHQQERGVLPTRNFQEAVFEGAEEISRPNLKKFAIKDSGCPICPIKCEKITLVREGLYAGALTDGPEYETLYAFGSACGIQTPEAIIAADMLCNNYGLDTISTGLTIAWAMECFGKGILSLDDTDALELRFGNHKAMVKAIKKIAYKEGKIGKLLSEGSRAASTKILKGTERFAMQVKGLEMGGYDPRGSHGEAIVFACGPRGGCHHGYGLAAIPEISLGTNLQYEGRGKFVRKTGLSRILFDSSMLCSHITKTAAQKMIAQLLSSVTGIAFEDLELIADRIATVERAFNAREGMTIKDDTLPERFFTEPLPSGPYKGQLISRDGLELMKKEFYKVMGWDSETGLPTQFRMEALGIKDVADELASIGLCSKAK